MVIVRTPLRVSLAGGGTDFPDYYRTYGGSIVGTAINVYTYVIVKKRFDRKIVLNYTKTEVVDSIEEIQHDLVREAARLVGKNEGDALKDGFEVTTLADVPSTGTGLGSSSSITVGLVNAFSHYINRPMSLGELARAAVRIEVDILKRPIGVQDQYLCALGGMQRLNFDMEIAGYDGDIWTSHRGWVSSETLRRLDDRLLLFYTGVGRKSEEILAEQKANISARREVLSRIHTLAGRTYKELKKGHLGEIPKILHESWTLKQKMAAGVSSPEIDRLYDKALQFGAEGGKILGAGGGGFLLLFVYPDIQDTFRRKMTAELGLQELPFRFETYGSRVLLNTSDGFGG